MADAPTPSNPPAAPQKRGWAAYLALFVALLALASAGMAFWQMQVRVQSLEFQVAQRIGESSSASKAANNTASEVRATVGNLTTRVNALEAQAKQDRNQQQTLQTIYQKLARGRDERLLAGIEYTLTLANQQLETAGNVRAALLGLEAAQSQLAQLNNPRFDGLRNAIRSDSGRLKALPAADIADLNTRLDSLLNNVDKLKLLSDQEAPKPAKAVSGEQSGWLSRLGSGVWGEIRQLVRIRRLDQPEPILLEPSQAYFLRQNLKLRLLSARLAAQQRDQATFRSDIAACQRWIGRYFDRNDELTRSTLQALAKMQSMPVTLKNANLDDSLRALHALDREAR